MLDIEKGNFTLPLNTEEISETRAEVVVGPLPGRIAYPLWPTGSPSTITAFKTPSILATYESFLIKVGCTLW